MKKKYTKKQITEAIAKWSKRLSMLEEGMWDEHGALTEEQWQEAADWFNANGYPIEDDEARLDQFAPQLDQFLFKAGCSPSGKDEVMGGYDAYILYKQMKDGKKPVNEDIELTADSPIEDFMTVADLKRLAEKTYPHNSTAWLTDNIACIINGKVVDFSKVKYVRAEGYPTNGTFFLMDGTDASLEAYEKEKAIMLSEKEKQDINEGRGWYGGGYGGSGRSYSSFGSHAARGAEIGWYYVSEIDPRAKGKIAEGWRCGPSNFVYQDFLYPERTYKRGAFTLRNTHAPEFGNVQLGAASYFDAVIHNDTEAIEKLTKMGLPLNLTFGLKPDDDYTNNYKLR